MCHMSHVTCHVPCVMFHLSPVFYHPTPVTCHQRQQQQPQTLPLLTPPLCRVGWFPKTEPKNPTNAKTQKRVKPSQKKGFLVLLFDQKSPALLLLVADRGDTEPTDIATSRLNWPRGRFREKCL